MSLEICILASGSAGNCTVVRAHADHGGEAGGVMLIDAGIGPRIAEQRMAGSGTKLADIRAICLTHLDADHFRSSWLRFVTMNRVKVYCNAQRIGELRRRVRYVYETDPDAPVEAFCAQLVGFGDEAFEPLAGVTVRAIPFAHDEAGSHGFVVECGQRRLGWATDLGKVPEHLIEGFADLDILALESNYDPGMQLASARPWFLKQRIMGGRGHLSNEQALEAIRKIFQKAEAQRGKLPAHVVLLHRSRECNCPRLVRKLFSRDPRIAQRLTLAEPFSRSQWLRPPEGKLHVGEQMLLGW